MKVFLLKAWGWTKTALATVWKWIKAGLAFVLDFSKWLKERNKDA